MNFALSFRSPRGRLSVPVALFLLSKRSSLFYRILLTYPISNFFEARAGELLANIYAELTSGNAAF